ncbi:TIR domain-containing adapter molecule 1 [Ctenopharyngodon idella]|uniref:TIR domain-containing adapter molecule 1 n=1 Tax=Ctenopharyngodon idella TaxID=7959 RepID=UPI00222ED2F6|nr:TIR domain-containing adapter molecule 1 [Ctenopharyngodon idella]
MAEELMERGFANLAKAFEILSQAAQERWFSLTFKMGRERPEELVHAMCLILLKRNSEAHAKLTANSDSSIGSYLAEMVKMHGERLNGGHIGGFKATDAKTLLDIARIFAILVQERLCDKSLRDQAYLAALAASRTCGLRSLDVEEEVKQVCGPDAIDKSNSELATYNLTSPDVSEHNDTRLLSQQSSSDCSSYSLEISSPTATESNTEESKPLSLRTATSSESTTSQDQLRRPTTNIRGNNQLQTAEVNNATNSKQCADRKGNSEVVTSKSTNINFSSSPNYSNAKDLKPPAQANSFCSPELSESSVEETFYAFVILHEAEDADEAQRLRERLESIISAPGATFSDDFAQPGRSTLRCIEDAIENSAFTLLLLTQNFKSNLSETTADSAIVNSLENHHKLNSVIPLLPRENRLSRESFPLVLRTKVFLDESRMFERNVLKAITPDKVAKQKKIWLMDQRKKKLREEQKRLREENVRNAELQRETEKFARLKLESEMQQNKMFHTASAPPPFNGAMYTQPGSWQPQQSCIHIENAQNVMIGNHSTMNIDHVKNSADEFDF